MLPQHPLFALQYGLRGAGHARCSYSGPHRPISRFGSCRHRLTVVVAAVEDVVAVVAVDVDVIVVAVTVVGVLVVAVVAATVLVVAVLVVVMTVLVVLFVVVAVCPMMATSEVCVAYSSPVICM